MNVPLVLEGELENYCSQWSEISESQRILVLGFLDALFFFGHGPCLLYKNETSRKICL